MPSQEILAELTKTEPSKVLIQEGELPTPAEEVYPEAPVSEKANEQKTEMLDKENPE